MIDEEKIPAGYWKDAKGSLIPVSKISDVDKARDVLVKSLMSEAKKRSGVLSEFRLSATQGIDDFMLACAEQYKVQLRGAAGKGNLTLTTYDGKYKVVRAVSDALAFDERLQIAKSLVDECIHVWAKGANRNLQALVNKAFDTDKEGKVNVGRVLALRSLKIEDEKWQKAMTLIADAMRVVSSKSYIRFYERNDETGEYKQVPLDIASA